MNNFFRTRVVHWVWMMFISSVATGQGWDAGLWLSADYEYRLTPRMVLVGSGELRFHDNAQSLRTMLADAGIEYSFHPDWRISGNFRLMGRQTTDQQYQPISRVYIDLRHRHRYRKMEWLTRLRVQQQSAHPVYHWFDDDAYSRRIRPELTVRYRINKTWRPFVSCELFFPIVYHYPLDPDKIRIAAGTRYRVSNVHALNVYLMVQQYVQQGAPKTDLMLGLGYSFTPEHTLKLKRSKH